MPGSLRLRIIVGIASIVSLASLAGVGLAGCGHSKAPRNLDLDDIRVLSDPKLRTDTVGDGKFASTASFVLVDAENTSGDGANVTLGGELTDASGAVVGHLRSQSLWIPSHDSRTFALVDTERVPRPTATAVRIKVHGAVIGEPPPARLYDTTSFDDHGKIVVQAFLVNTGGRPGQIMVIGSFHDAHGQPMTRPFQLIDLRADERRVVQLVGPQGSVRGQIFIGDTVY
jgi:hypothetical protein